MTRFFTSDPHFGHANIIMFCQRPFRSVEHMNDVLVDNWNAVVRPEDEVWVLGDVAMGKLDDSLEQIQFLNGTKHLVSGNHDRTWGGHKKGQEAAAEKYLAAGFATIQDEARLTLVDGRKVLLSHFPYKGDNKDKDRYVEARPHDDGSTWLLHGHVHEVWRQRGRMINVGVDVWGQTPVSEATIISAISAGERNLDRFGDPAKEARHGS